MKEQEAILRGFQADLAKYNSEIRAPMAYFMTELYSAIPQKFRDNPGALRRWATKEITEFYKENVPKWKSSARDFQRFVTDAVDSFLGRVHGDVKDPGGSSTRIETFKGVRPGGYGWKRVAYERSRDAGYKGSYDDFLRQNGWK